MSSQKGNVARSRPQRHQNTFSFKNDKFDKSVKTKMLPVKDANNNKKKKMREGTIYYVLTRKSLYCKYIEQEEHFEYF
uniref:Uncharacterized protein n=1 Tax=Rousettus aegyptiacus TaxID=9407 RepID=A0A7J8IH01_ROUAE|nr:hypothetical protein HJG63_001950 [Rousettus aegyptiacus]